MKASGATAYLVNTGWNLKVLLPQNSAPFEKWDSRTRILANQFIDNFIRFSGTEGKLLAQAGPIL